MYKMRIVALAICVLLGFMGLGVSLGYGGEGEEQVVFFYGYGVFMNLGLVIAGGFYATQSRKLSRQFPSLIFFLSCVRLALVIVGTLLTLSSFCLASVWPKLAYALAGSIFLLDSVSALVAISTCFHKHDT